MKVIIIGGGIGGLMTAITLLEKGYTVNVFEQAPVLKELGAGILLAPNALAILQKYQLTEPVFHQGRRLNKASIVDTNDRIISEIDFHSTRRKYGFESVAIHRAAFQKILAGHLPVDLLKTGKQFTGFIQEEGSVTARFMDGTHERADLLIGADGLHSTVRKQIYPDQKLRASNLTCWRFVTEYKLSNAEQNNLAEIWGNEKGVRFGYVSIDEKHVYCYITAFIHGKLDPLQTSLKEYLLHLCREFSPTVIQLIASINETQIIQHDLYDLALAGDWYSNRVVLLGDAAHASTPKLGQGACQAIEDAYALSLCLKDGNRVNSELREYQNLRRSKAEFITKTSRNLESLTNTSGWQKSMAKALFRFTPSYIMARQQDKIYSVDYLNRYKDSVE